MKKRSAWSKRHISKSRCPRDEVQRPAFPTAARRGRRRWRGGLGAAELPGPPALTCTWIRYGLVGVQDPGQFGGDGGMSAPRRRRAFCSLKIIEQYRGGRRKPTAGSWGSWRWEGGPRPRPSLLDRGPIFIFLWLRLQMKTRAVFLRMLARTIDGPGGAFAPPSCPLLLLDHLVGAGKQ